MPRRSPGRWPRHCSRTRSSRTSPSQCCDPGVKPRVILGTPSVDEEGQPVEIKFTLQLPRDALSVPVVRRVLNSSMRTLGVADECLTDIELALTEACTNV